MALILRLRMSLVLASSRAAPQVWMVLILVRFFVAVLVDSYRGAGPIYIYIYIQSSSPYRRLLPRCRPAPALGTCCVAVYRVGASGTV
jgi:hypothetical protein